MESGALARRSDFFRPSQPYRTAAQPGKWPEPNHCGLVPHLIAPRSSFRTILNLLRTSHRGDEMNNRNFSLSVLWQSIRPWKMLAVLVTVGAVALLTGLSSRFHARALVAPAGYLGGPVAGDHTGQWLIDPAPDVADSAASLRVTIRYDHRYGGWSSSSSLISPTQFAGLSAQQIASEGSSVKFQIVRDAGTFNCEGWFARGSGSGHFEFAANPQFAQELKRLGIGSPCEDQQFSFAVENVDLALIHELKEEGYPTPSLDQLVTIGEHGVRLEYLKGLNALGYRVNSIDSLVVLRDHGVTPDFIKGLQDLGYRNVSAEDLRNARDHGVTPKYIAELKTSGISGLSLDDLVRARDHGVTARFVEALRTAGYSGGVDDLITVRDHGVTPDFIDDLKSLGYGQVRMDELVAARDHGVQGNYIRSIVDEGYKGLPLEEIVRMRDHGVTPGFIERMKSHGYGDLSVDQLIRLRDEGVK
jgi:hypothetical protein